MLEDRKTFAAGLLRFVLAFAAIALLPLVFEGFAKYRAIFFGYAAVAVMLQVLIYKEIGAGWRAFLGGILDIALITFIVQRVGTAHTMLVSLYVVAGVINTLFVGATMGLVLSVIAVIALNTVIVAESLGLIPYAPDALLWGVHDAPNPAQAIALGLGMSFLILITTTIAAVLVRTNTHRTNALEKANKQLGELTRQDSLTQLFNRRHVLQTIDHELAWLNRGRSLAVVMIDLDRFKRVNDARGHLAGDELLRRVADTLVASKREVDVAGRYGGDEFVIVLPETDRDQARIAATRFVDEIRRVGLEFDPENPVTASAGISIAQPEDTIEMILSRADERAFAAKRRGGNNVFA